MIFLLIDSNNRWLLYYSNNAGNKVIFETKSNGTGLPANTASEPFRSLRYSLHSLISNFKENNVNNIYVDGTTITMG